MTHINSISCGQGAPSLFLIVMAGRGMFPADVVIAADTGWERDCLWSNGNRTTNKEFFEQVTKPLALFYGLEPYFVRAKDGEGKEFPPLDEFIRQERQYAGKDGRSEFTNVHIPMFGSKGGRLSQSCTSKFKIRAIRQKLRELGATTATTALGLHVAEAHRAKMSDVNWNWNIWPMLDMGQEESGKIVPLGIGRRFSRNDANEALNALGVPYLVTTECDGCPHKDAARWKRTSAESLQQSAQLESLFDGELFLTPQRRPLLEALQAPEDNGQMEFDMCESGYCFL